MEQYHVTGMSCAACSARVEKAVGKVAGVTSCSVSLLTNSMGVEGTASSEDVIAAVKAAGYGAAVKEEKGNSAKAPDALETDASYRFNVCIHGTYDVGLAPAGSFGKKSCGSWLA